MRCAPNGSLGWDSISPGSVFSTAADRVFGADSGFRVGSCTGPSVWFGGIGGILGVFLGGGGGDVGAGRWAIILLGFEIFLMGPNFLNPKS